MRRKEILKALLEFIFVDVLLIFPFVLYFSDSNVLSDILILWTLQSLVWFWLVPKLKKPLKNLINQI